MRFVRIGLALAGIAFMSVALIESLPNLPEILKVGAGPMLGSFLAAFASVVSLSHAWVYLFESSPGPMGQVLRTAFLRTLPAKYIPGGLAQQADLIERTSLATGIPRRQILARSAAHVALIVLGALTLGAITALTDPRLPRPLLLGMLGPVLLHDRVWKVASRPLGRLAGVTDETERRSMAPANRLRCFLWTTISILTSGVSFALLAGDEIGGSPATLTFGFALSFLVGYVAFVVPAGLGVREVAMSSVFPGMPLGAAVLISAAHRSIAVLAEAGAFCWTHLRKGRR